MRFGGALALQYQASTQQVPVRIEFHLNWLETSSTTFAGALCEYNGWQLQLTSDFLIFGDGIHPEMLATIHRKCESSVQPKS
jgi:hypothetical protein